jgi:sulfur-carrier protein
MTINLKYFGLIADITKTSEEVFTLTELLLTTEDLVNNLHQKYSNLQETPFVIAVNKTIVTSALKLNNNDTIALLPPFAGG